MAVAVAGDPSPVDARSVPLIGARAWAISPRVLLLSVLVAVFLLVPLVSGYLLAGPSAAIAIGMGYVALARPAFSLPPAHALALAIPATMAGAVAVAVRSEPVAAACFVALCCLLVAPVNQLHDGLLAGVPSLAAVLVAVPGSYDPGWTAVAILVGCGTLVLVATRAPRTRPPSGIPQLRAWRHATVMALAAGGVVYAVAALQVPHGYWIALTLTIVLRPFDDQTWSRSWQRIVGTLAGVVLALLLAALLPLWAMAIALGVCLVLTLAYTVQDDYVRQVMFLTPTVVLLAAPSGVGVIASERAVATIVGALLATAVALLLAWYEKRKAKTVEVS